VIFISLLSVCCCAAEHLTSREGRHASRFARQALVRRRPRRSRSSRRRSAREHPDARDRRRGALSSGEVRRPDFRDQRQRKPRRRSDCSPSARASSFSQRQMGRQSLAWERCLRNVHHAAYGPGSPSFGDDGPIPPRVSDPANATGEVARGPASGLAYPELIGRHSVSLWKGWNPWPHTLYSTRSMTSSIG
jgi:hypothetical protein